MSTKKVANITLVILLSLLCTGSLLACYCAKQKNGANNPDCQLSCTPRINIMGSILQFETTAETYDYTSCAREGSPDDTCSNTRLYDICIGYIYDLTDATCDDPDPSLYYITEMGATFTSSPC